MSTVAQARPVQASRSFGPPWIALCLAMALHVTDEALTGFLNVYNPSAMAIRRRLGLPFPPTFGFGEWLALLMGAFAVLLGLSPLAFRGHMRWFAYAFAVIMLANGTAHIVSSMYFGRFMPGVYSSPVLLACSVWLIASLRRTSSLA